MVVLILVAVLILPPAIFGPSQIVTPGQLKNYASSYISEYQTLYLDNAGIVATHSSPSRFAFGFSGPTGITCVISLSHGALILFNSTTSSSFTVTSITQDRPIEYYLWPNMPTNPAVLGIPAVIVANGTYALDAPVNDSKGPLVIDPGAVIRYNGSGDAFRLSGNGSATILGSLIYSQRMILKGDNAPAAWTPLQAQFDALDQFIADGSGLFNATQASAIQTKYRVPLLLTLIGDRIGDGSYKNNPSLFTADYSELSKYAPSDTLLKVQSDYLASQEAPQPSIWQSALSSPIAVGVIATVIAAIIIAVGTVAYRRIVLRRL